MARVAIPPVQNLILRSQDQSDAAWTREALTSVTTGLADPLGGTNACDLVDTVANTNHDVFQSPAFVVGRTCTLSCWAKAGSRSFLVLWFNGFTLRTWFNLSTGVVATNGALSAFMIPYPGGWYRCGVTWLQSSATSGEVIGAANVDGAFAYAGAADAAIRVFGAQASMSTGPQSYIATAGAAVNTGAIRNVGSQAQNLILRSDAFANAAWSAIRETPTDNSVTAPDGTTTACTMIEDGSNNSHLVVQNSGGAPAESELLTASIFVKANGRHWIALAPAAGTYAAWFDVTAGTVGTIATGTERAAITPASQWYAGAPAGWWRCEITYKHTPAFLLLSLYTSTGDTILNYQGDGVSGLFLWRAQIVQAGNWAGTPQATAGAIVNTGPLRNVRVFP